MADVFQFGFGDPSNFSDFAKYAGLDRKTGTPTPYDLGQKEGVAPPESLADLWQQKAVDPFNKKIENFKQQGTNISNAIDQFGQGNLVKGFNAMSGTAPASQTTQTSIVPWTLPVSGME